MPVGAHRSGRLVSALACFLVALIPLVLAGCVGTTTTAAIHTFGAQDRAGALTSRLPPPPR